MLPHRRGHEKYGSHTIEPLVSGAFGALPRHNFGRLAGHAAQLRPAQVLADLESKDPLDSEVAISLLGGLALMLMDRDSYESEN